MNASDLPQVVVGMFPDAYVTTSVEASLATVLSSITTGRYKAKAIRSRELFCQWQKVSPGDNKSPEAIAYADFKKTLPAFLMSGFSPDRTKGKALDRHSGLLQVDLDKLGERLPEVREKVRHDPHVLFGFVSPSGIGLKLGLVIDGGHHKDSFLSAEVYFRERYGLEIDPSVKNPLRLCFVSDDPDAWISDHADPLPITVQEKPKPSPLPATASPSSRQKIAEHVLGTIQWGDGNVTGYCKCPGLDRHTTKNEPRDCKVWLGDTIPSISCFHGSCKPVVDGVNHELRSQIAKAEFVPTRQAKGGTGVASEYLASEDEYAESLGGGVELEVPSGAGAELSVIEAIPIGLLERPPECDPTELLKHRFLCERGSLLIPGPTGMGKSSFLMQCLALWANSSGAFGIAPARALTSVLIQAENDDGDMAEMRDGICHGLGLTVSQRETFFSKVLVYSSAGLTGRAFCDRIVKPLLERHKPNLIVIDPALSYLGGDTKDQKDVGNFLRVHLNPLIFANKCASVMIHHTNKPLAGKEKPNWKNGEFAYLGSGSAEWANWARAILSFQATGTSGVYSLHAAKRGSRLGWKDEEGTKIYEKLIKHSVEAGIICWKDATEEDLTESGTGRPEKCGLNDLLDLISEQSLSTGDWRTAAGEELGIGKTAFYRKLDMLKDAGSVAKNKITGRWEKILIRVQK